MSMTLLVVPALGVVLSAIVLHERISLSLICGLFLIVAGIRWTTRPAPPTASGFV
jgi:drug/metabolite transporter (DMT)-like permease